MFLGSFKKKFLLLFFFKYTSLQETFQDKFMGQDISKIHTYWIKQYVKMSSTI